MRLEQELGFRLFERGPHVMELTAEGKAFCRIAQDFLDRSENLRAARNETDALINGHLKIGVVDQYPFTMVAQICRDFKIAYPNIKVELEKLALSQVTTALRSGSCDVVFSSAACFGDSDTFSFLVMGHRERKVVVPHDHPYAKLTSIAIRDILEDNFVFFRREITPTTYDMMLRLFRYYDRIPNIVQTVGSASELVLCVSSGIGLTISAFHFPQYEADATLATVKIDTSDDPTGTLAELLISNLVLARNKHTRNPSVRLFTELAQKTRLPSP